MKKQLAAGLACYMLATTAQADVVIGNPMAVTGPIPDLVAPMVAAVDLAEKHINEQGGMFASGEKFVVVELIANVILLQQLMQSQNLST